MYEWHDFGGAFVKITSIQKMRLNIKRKHKQTKPKQNKNKIYWCPFFSECESFRIFGSLKNISLCVYACVYNVHSVHTHHGGGMDGWPGPSKMDGR